jgi:hypothetical protein
VSIDVQGGEARDITRARGHYRKPKIKMESLEPAAPRANRRHGELPHHAQRRHAHRKPVVSSRLSEDRSRARPCELRRLQRHAQMHEPGTHELGGSRGSIDPGGRRFEHR